MDYDPTFALGMFIVFNYFKIKPAFLICLQEIHFHFLKTVGERIIRYATSGDLDELEGRLS